MKTLVASAEPPRPPGPVVPWTITVPALEHHNLIVRWRELGDQTVTTSTRTE